MGFDITLTGIAGTNGASVLSGVGAPPAALGDINDTYIDVGPTAAIYKKMVAGWGAGVSLLGGKGDKGASIIAVIGAPAAELGDDGDYSFDPNTGLLYGPKASGAWPAGVSLKGADGVSVLAPIASWAANTTYTAKAPASFVAYNGSSYACIVSHVSGATFDPTKFVVVAGQGQTGPQSFAAVQAWTGASAYSSVAPISVVTYLGSAYLCATTHQSTSTFDATKWTLLVSKGDKGVAPFSSIVAWAASTAYTPVAPASAVFYNGNVYICSIAHTSGTTFDVSKFTLLFTSVLPFSTPAAWVSGTAYSNLPPASAVTYAGSTYVCTTAHTAGAAFDQSKWVLLASQGSTGGKGDTGPQGSTGVAGPAAWQTPPVAWAQNGAYSATAPASLVIYAGLVYVATTTHTAGATFDSSKFVQISAQGSFVSTNISDSTQAGRALLSAADVLAQRKLLIIDSRASVADQDYVVPQPLAVVAYTAITATRQVKLPAANTYNPGQIMSVVDEGGGCSSTININVVAAGSDSVNGVAGTTIVSKYGYVSVESDGVSKWTIVDSCNFAFIDSPSFTGKPKVPTPAKDDNSTLIVNSAWFAGQASSNKPIVDSVAASGSSLRFAREDHVHDTDPTRAPIDSPVFTTSVKVPKPAAGDSSLAAAPTSWVVDALAAQRARTEVSDVAYNVLTTDRLVAVLTLTAARVINLPDAATFPKGTKLTVVDESGNCSPTKTLTIDPNGTQKVNGAATAVMTTPYAYMDLETNGSGWTITSQTTGITSAMLDSAFGTTNGGLLVRQNGTWAALPPGAAGGFLQTNGAGNAPGYASPLTGFQNLIINGNFAINQRGYASNNNYGAANYMHDRWKTGTSGGAYSFNQGTVDTTIQITLGSIKQVVEGQNVIGGNYTLSWLGSAQGRVYIQGADANSLPAYASGPIQFSGFPQGSSLVVEFTNGTLGLVSFVSGLYPLVFERRPQYIERLWCERYFQFRSLSGRNTAGPNLTTAYPVCLPGGMAAIPTCTRIGTTSSTNLQLTTLVFQSAQDGKWAMVANAAGDCLATGDLWSLFAEL